MSFTCTATSITFTSPVILGRRLALTLSTRLALKIGEPEGTGFVFTWVNKPARTCLLLAANQHGFQRIAA